MIAGLIFVNLGDLATGLLLPTGAEANPLAAQVLVSPLLALAGKAAMLALVLVAASAQTERGRRLLLGMGIAGGVVGLLSNIIVLAA